MGAAVTISTLTNLGAAVTISRLTKLEYVRPDKQEMFSSLGIDKIISPTQLAV